MKKFSILFLLTFQMLFAQKVHIKGIAIDSGKFPNRGGVTIIVNDTINRYTKYHVETFKNKLETAYSRPNPNLATEYNKSKEILKQLPNNRDYVAHTDFSGNFEIIAKLTDSLFFESYDHQKQKYLVADLVKKKKINIKLRLEPCEIWPSHPEKPTKLYVFVGKKIKVWNSPSGYCNGIAFDSRTLAEYEVVQNVYNNFPKKSIKFTSYSHEAPIPQNYSPDITSFSQSDYSLLYILKYNGEYIQVKYLFDDVYMTKEGKWASPFRPRGIFNLKTSEPEKIDFATPIVFTYDKKFEFQIKQIFSEKYSHISDGTISVTYGFYVDDLFKIRRDSRLKEYEYLMK